MSNFPELKIVYPEFNSNLTNTVIELEKLRQKHRYIDSKVHPVVFFQLKDIFHILESIGSVRIEGNNTTVSDYLEHTIESKPTEEENFKEIKNVENALKFIEDSVNPESQISRGLILELHKIVVDGLDPQKDGDKTPGLFRNNPVRIKNSLHKPPNELLVPELMDELLNFINGVDETKDQLLSIAVAHHRFSWIHPFSNGNGRVVRLLTFAMLIKQGFSVKGILNPAAVFCNDRDKYYDQLAIADKYDEKSTLVWCDYVLTNLLEEVNKIDKLLNKEYLLGRIITPALDDALKLQYISKDEFKILKVAVELGEFKAADVGKVIEYRYPIELSRLISNLKEKKMIDLSPGKSRVYVPKFYGNFFTRSLIGAFRREGFIPESLS